MTHDVRNQETPEESRKLLPETAERGRRRSDRTHAIFSIVRGLEAIGLATWTHPLLTFLGRYDGIEEFAWEDDPIPALQQLVEHHAQSGCKVLSGTIAAEVIQLQVLHYRVAWFKAGEVQACSVWDPLETDFLDFIEDGIPGAEWRIWKTDEPNPDAELVKRYLLADYVKVNGFR
ncbi:MAG: hypothetical protein EKK47_20260 [Burkholderiales bacterium]|nr:MAG: hypothetical protein EKK47_20260 [Burkholderiales bacterium]